LIRNGGTTGHVIADAVSFVPAFGLRAEFTGIPWQDDDNDGVCNYVEYLNGTNPHDPASHLKIKWQWQAGASAIGFVAASGKSYTIQYREAIAGGTWLKLMDLSPTNLTREVQIPEAATNRVPQRFYRLVSPKIP
jgi:hypothetical protein